MSSSLFLLFTLASTSPSAAPPAEWPGQITIVADAPARELHGKTVRTWLLHKGHLAGRSAMKIDQGGGTCRNDLLVPGDYLAIVGGEGFETVVTKFQVDERRRGVTVRVKLAPGKGLQGLTRPEANELLETVAARIKETESTIRYLERMKRYNESLSHSSRLREYTKLAAALGAD